MDEMLARILKCMGPGHGSGKELADFLGVNPNVITNWKNGSNRSYRKYINQIAEHYGVSVDYLLTGEQKEKPAAKSDEPDIKDILLDTKTKAAKGITLMYNGKPINERTMKAFEASLEAAIALLESSQEE